MEIRWLGHASFQIKAKGKIVYIDPYVLPVNSEQADLILITHDHYDHCDSSKVEEVRKPGTIIVTTEKAAGKLSGDVRVIAPNKVVEVDFASVRAVPAYNLNKPFHSRGIGVGFILSMEGKNVYHAGDTDFIPEMKLLKNIDVALLPIGGTYTMDVEDAVEAALAIKPRIAVPMHYNYLEGLERDPMKFKNGVEGKDSSVRVEILEGGKVLKV